MGGLLESGCCRNPWNPGQCSTSSYFTLLPFLCHQHYSSEGTTWLWSHLAQRVTLASSLPECAAAQGGMKYESEGTEKGGRARVGSCDS